MIDSVGEAVRRGINPIFEYVTIDQKNEVELSMGIRDRVLYITFLGSVSKMDWRHNFMFWKLPYRRMKKWFFVHAGFLKIYKIVRNHIHTVLEEKASEYDAIQINGHSLGGAVTSLCLEDVVFLQEELGVPYLVDKIVLAVTSGAPRAFGVLFSKLPRQRCRGLLRVRYRNDQVPRVPFGILGYKHVGTELQLGKSNLLGWLHPSAIYCHSVKSYREWNGTRVDTDENNELYSIATKVYHYIYGALALFAGLFLTWGLIL